MITERAAVVERTFSVRASRSRRENRNFGAGRKSGENRNPRAGRANSGNRNRRAGLRYRREPWNGSGPTCNESTIAIERVSAPGEYRGTRAGRQTGESRQSRAGRLDGEHLDPGAGRFNREDRITRAEKRPVGKIPPGKPRPGPGKGKHKRETRKENLT